MTPEAIMQTIADLEIKNRTLATIADAKMVENLSLKMMNEHLRATLRATPKNSTGDYQTSNGKVILNLSGQAKLMPTPQHGDYKGHSPGIMKAVKRHKEKGVHKQVGLRDAVKLWPTPSSMPRGPHTNRKLTEGGQTISDKTGTAWGMTLETAATLSSKTSGQLNPEFVEWLMGVPSGWTDLKHSGTAKHLARLFLSEKL